MLGAGVFAYQTIPGKIQQSLEWYHVLQWRQGVDVLKIDKTRPFYEYARSPSQEQGEVKFEKAVPSIFRDFRDSVEKGDANVIKMPDGSWLYVRSLLSKEDKEYVARAFWQQRWRRYWDILGGWLWDFSATTCFICFRVGPAMGCEGFKSA